jgi:hypothetical protein
MEYSNSSRPELVGAGGLEEWISCRKQTPNVQLESFRYDEDALF